MKMPALLILVAAAALASCRPAQQAPPLPEDSDRDAVRRNLPDADLNASLVELGAAPIFPYEQTLPIVGDWAEEASSCGAHAWRFTTEGLQTPSGATCQFQRTTPVTGGYDVEAQCRIDGEDQLDSMAIQFEGSERMRFRSETIGDAQLTSCRHAR